MYNKDVKKAAYSLLSRREHSAKELKEKLVLREYQVADIEPVLSALAEQDIQSDLRFGESLLRTRLTKGYGWSYICAELKQKGLASDIIAQVEQTQSIDWFEQAKNAYQKRFPDPKIYDQKDKAKRIRFLQYRGFDFEQISAALNLD
ncbi:regulatory protein RecX [Thalassomonas sp. M1454]|uniref:regulatory protein RecX n=1 Tax=Thalassomonas sp. M1454 TaxID=2594477 RepID=UPI00117E9F35|nr:regulatory protein RecX [Thalassomonas sp. M1454]TRX55800.1 regulatory protein RecX [Thalassomonas sp. M1454]